MVNCRIIAGVGALLAAAALLPAGTASAVQGILDTDFPAVGAIGLTVTDLPGAESDHRFICSGALISPTAFITAHHCADLITQMRADYDVTDVWVSFSNDLHGWFDAQTPAHGAPVDPPSTVAVDATVPPGLLPGYHAGANPAFNDLAVYTLAAALTSIQPITLTSANLLDSLRQADRPVFMTVGYGVWVDWSSTPRQPQTWNWEGQRQHALISYQALTSTQVVTNQNLSSRIGGGNCIGDSGGPLFYKVNGAWLAVGTTVWGDIPCRAIGFFQRLDLPSVLDFLAPYVR